MDSAQLRADKNTPGVAKGLTISENYALHFSKDGQRLFIGLAPIRPVKDSTKPDFEKAAVDVWNYHDDDLQPVQLKNLEKDLKKSYLAILEKDKNNVLQLGDEKFPEILITQEGNGNTFYGSSDFGKRIERQWQGFTLSDVYAINANTGIKTIILKNFKGIIYPSYTGKYLLLYNEKEKAYSVYNSETNLLHKVAADIKFPLYDEENDVPDDPKPYGIAGWEKEDRHIYIYDRYNIWQVDPEGKASSTPAISLYNGRNIKVSARYVKVNQEEKYIDPGKKAYLELYNEISLQQISKS
jgi:hypothetical protein